MSERDNWERLVAAVLKREQLWQLCHQDSRSPSISTISSDTASDFSGQILNFSSDSSGPTSASPSAPLQLASSSVPQVRKNAFSGPITRKLFSAWYGRRKPKDEDLVHIPASEASRYPSKTSNSSVPSNISILSYSGKSSAESLPTPRSEAAILSSPNVKAFSFNELRNATRNFGPDSFLGEGGFGYVFKGWIDDHTLSVATPGSGLVIAVKNLKPEGFQGHKEWLTEVNYLGQLHHPNLVKLIGYCSEAEYRLLVYEFMPRGSLENHLFRREPQPLSWATRVKVAIGAARGLCFLHEAEEQVIYRDFKASNILLDGEFNAKLSDFGLAKAGPTGDRTHVSTQVMGTHGYDAPEYVATGRSTAKSDVYSFGVVLLELLSGRRAVDKAKVGVEQILVDWAKPYMGEKRKLFRIMDIKLEGQYPQKAAFTAAAIALQCLSDEPKLRPRMAEVLTTLEELQAPKSATRRPKAENQIDSISISPVKHHSPINITPLASPLPANRRASRVR